jgi:hypothetical protein
MIPEIGLMVGCYIVFRCVEALCAAPQRYGGEIQRFIVAVLGVLTIAATIFIVIALLGTGSSVPQFPNLK